jgi:hypothetical protein
VRDAEAARTDADNLKGGRRRHSHRDLHERGLPGVVSLFFRNDHYKDFETTSMPSPRPCATSTRR